MESKARVLRHPMHPILVMFPTALFPLLLFLDALGLWLGEDAFWVAGFWIAVAGVVTTLAAMVPGTIDMAAIPDGTKAHRTGLIHAVVGTGILLLYGAAVWLRWPAGAVPENALLVTGLDALGVLAVTVQGFLGGELVYRHHVGVLTEAEGGDPVALKGSEPGAGGRAAVRRRGAERP